jgi:transcription antitermination factor NusG
LREKDSEALFALSAGPEETICPLGGESEESHLRWFAVYTNSRHEKSVARHFGDRQIEHFLPLYPKKHQWAKRKSVTLELPLFPNYVFVRVPPGQRIRVLTVPGVLGMVGCGQVPSPLPEVEIAALQASVKLARCEPHRYLVAGERVRVRSGAMEGMEGILIRKKNELRLVLTLQLIQRSVAVELDCADVEPVVYRPPVMPLSIAYSQLSCSAKRPIENCCNAIENACLPFPI